MNRFLIPALGLLSACTPLVVDSALKGAALMSAALLGALLLWRASAAARHLVWLVAVVALLSVPVLSLVLPGWRVLPAWAVPPAVGAAAYAPQKDGPYETHEPHTPYLLPGRTAPVSPPPPLANPPEPASATPLPAAAPFAALPPAAAPVGPAPAVVAGWRSALPLLWTTGCAVLLLRLLGAHWLLRRTARRARPVADGPLAAALAAAAAQLGMKPRVRLLLDGKRTIPVVWGVWRPTLLLPSEALTWDAGQLRSVLLHELGHIRRRDTLVQWLTQLACALHWFNPLVWLAAWRLHVERERACDDLVLASGVKPSAYAGHLLHVASQLSPARWTSACGLAMARKSALEGRLLAVLSDRLNRRRLTRALTAAAILLSAAIAVPIAMLRAADEEWNPPSGAHVGGNDFSAFCIHDGKDTSFVIAYHGDFDSSSRSSSNAKARTWNNDVTLTAQKPGIALGFLRTHSSPDKLVISVTPAEGRDLSKPAPAPRDFGQKEYDLAKGRVFLFTDSGLVRQLDLPAPVVRDQEALKMLSALISASPSQQGDKIALKPNHKDAVALYEIWQRHARLSGDIPGALIGELAAAVKVFIGYNPTWETVPKLNAILPRLDASHDWKAADAIALLDEVAAVQDSPLLTAAEKMTAGTIRQGGTLPGKFAGVAWGETQPNGLRAAWVLEPGSAEHRIGTALKARLLVQNTGTIPVMTRVPTWHQGSVSARDAAGAEVEVSGISWTTMARLIPIRLAPGEFIEINAPGVGLGKDAGRGPWAGPRVGSNVITRDGPELTLTHGPLALDGSGVGMREDAPHLIGPGWWQAHIKARLARELPLPADAAERTRLLDRAVRELFASPPTADETAAFTADQTDGTFDALVKRLATRTDVAEFSGKLETAPVKFRVLAADPAADKTPRAVLGPGEYPIGKGATLKIVGKPVGVGEQIYYEAKIDFVGRAFYKLDISYGSDWAIVCRPGDDVLYLLQRGGVLKVDFSGSPIRVEGGRNELLPTGFPEEVKRQLEIREVPAARQAEIFEQFRIPTPPPAAPKGISSPVNPKHEYAQSLFRKWQASARTDGKIPGALIGHVAREVDSFLKQYPENEKAPQLAALRPQLDASRDWTQQEVVAMLDEITAISTAPVSWAATPMEFDAGRKIQRGQPLPKELEGAAWGEPAANGVRAAWLLEPAPGVVWTSVVEFQYPLGSVLKARVLFHNAGKEPIVFQTETWHQDDPHTARDAKGAEIPVKATWFTGITPMATFRLAPGEYCEVSGHGIAIGAGEYKDEFSTGAVGAIIEAKEGDVVTLSHTVDAAYGGWTKPGDPQDPVELRKQIIAERVNREAPMPRSAADREQLIRRVTLDLTGVAPTAEEIAAFTADDAPNALAKLTARLQAKPRVEPFSGKLPTGEMKFRVTAADPNAAKAPRAASAPGRYVLGDGVHLQVRQVTENGKRTNSAEILFFGPDPKQASPHRPYQIALPDGLNSYCFLWERGSGTLKVVERGSVRTVDFSKPDAVMESRAKENLAPDYKNLLPPGLLWKVGEKPADEKPKTGDAGPQRKVDWSKPPDMSEFEGMYDPELLARLAAKPEKLNEDSGSGTYVWLLADQILRAAVEGDAQFRHLLADDRLKAADIDNRILTMSLAAYDYSVFGNKAALKVILERLESGQNEDYLTAFYLGFVDEWDQSIPAVERVFAHRDGGKGDEYHGFWAHRQWFFPESYAAFQKKQLESNQLDAASLQGVWKGSKEGVDVTLRFGKSQDWEVRFLETDRKSALSTDPSYTATRLHLRAANEKGTPVHCGILSRGSDGALLLHVLEHGGKRKDLGYLRVNDLVLTKEADTPKGAEAGPRRKVDWSKPPPDSFFEGKYDPELLARLAAKLEKLSEDTESGTMLWPLAEQILRAAVEGDPQFRHLLTNEKLKAADDDNRILTMSLAAYDYSVFGNKAALKVILDQLEHGQHEAYLAAFPLGFVDEWDQSIPAVERVFAQRDGAKSEEYHRFWIHREWFFPEKYAAFQKKQLKSNQLDAASLQGVWKGSKEGVDVTLRFGKSQDWEVRFLETDRKSALSTEPSYTATRLYLKAANEKGTPVHCGTLSRASDGALLLQVLEHGGRREQVGYLRVNDLVLTKETDARKGTDAGLRRKIDWSKGPSWNGLSQPFDPAKALALAEAVKKSDGDTADETRRLMFLILQATAERAPELRPLLEDKELRRKDDDFHSFALALAAYDFAVNGNRQGLQFILDTLASGPGGDVQAAVPLGFIDEWDLSIAAHKKHFDRGSDGAAGEARGAFWKERKFFFPESFARFQKAALAATKLDAESLNGTWKGAKDGMTVELRLGKEQHWEVRHGDNLFEEDLISSPAETGEFIFLIKLREKGGQVPRGKLSRGERDELHLEVWPQRGANRPYPQVNDLVLTREADTPKGAEAGPRRKVDWSKFPVMMDDPANPYHPEATLKLAAEVKQSKGNIRALTVSILQASVEKAGELRPLLHDEELKRKDDGYHSLALALAAYDYSLNGNPKALQYLLDDLAGKPFGDPGASFFLGYIDEWVASPVALIKHFCMGGDGAGSVASIQFWNQRMYLYPEKLALFKKRIAAAPKLDTKSLQGVWKGNRNGVEVELRIGEKIRWEIRHGEMHTFAELVVQPNQNGLELNMESPDRKFQIGGGILFPGEAGTLSLQLGRDFIGKPPRYPEVKDLVLQRQEETGSRQPKGAMKAARKVDWSKFPYYGTPQIPFVNPFEPGDALRLAAAPDKSEEDVKRLLDMIHQAAVEQAVELRPLLADDGTLEVGDAGNLRLRMSARTGEQIEIPIIKQAETGVVPKPYDRQQGQTETMLTRAAGAAAIEPRQWEARELLRMWKAAAYGNETIPGMFLWTLVTEAQAYADANSNLDSMEKLLELFDFRITERDWTQAQVIPLLDTATACSDELLKACLASEKLSQRWLGTWEGKIEGRACSLWIVRRGPAVTGITMMMLYPEEASVDDLGYNANSNRASLDLRLGHEDGKTTPFGRLEPVSDTALRFIPAGTKRGGGGVTLTRKIEVPPTEPREQPARDLFTLWKSTANADGSIPGTFIGQLATEVRAFGKAHSGRLHADNMVKLLPRFVTARDWTQAEAISLLDDVAHYSSDPIEARVAKAKLPSGPMWRTMVEFQDLPVAIAKWSGAKDGLRIGLRVVGGQWSAGGSVRVELWLHNPGGKDVSFRTAGPNRQDVEVSFSAIDAEGQEHWPERSPLNFMSPLLDCTLPAGHVAMAKEFDVTFADPDNDVRTTLGSRFRDLKPGQYQLRGKWFAAKPKPSKTGEHFEFTAPDFAFTLGGAAAETDEVKPAPQSGAAEERVKGQPGN